MAGASSTAPISETGGSARAGRRRFTVEYKTWVVQEAARYRETGEVGAFLRRKGLFSSQLTMWRKQYQAGVRHAFKRTAPELTVVLREDVPWVLIAAIAPVDDSIRPDVQ